MGCLLSILWAIHSKFWSSSYSEQICVVYSAYLHSKCQLAFSQGSLNW